MLLALCVADRLNTENDIKGILRKDGEVVKITFL